MQRALESAMGLPRRSTRAPRMLEFLIPAEVRRSFMVLDIQLGCSKRNQGEERRGRIAHARVFVDSTLCAIEGALRIVSLASQPTASGGRNVRRCYGRVTPQLYDRRPLHCAHR